MSPGNSTKEILVVDDDEAIRWTLREACYTVLTASDGTEALAIYGDKKNEIAVVLTDMVMPFMDGPDTIRAFAAHEPEGENHRCQWFGRRTSRRRRRARR